MNAIPVETVGMPASYGTPAAAIAGAAGHHNQPKARRDGAILQGRTFVDAWCSLSEWVIEFSGPVWLRVTAVPDAADDADPADLVKWAVVHERPDVVATTEPIVLAWDPTSKSVTDPAGLAAARHGAAFWQLWANEGGLLVYVRGHDYLSFHAVRRTDTREILLFTCEEE